MRTTLPDIIANMESFLEDSNADDYAKVFVKGFLDDLKTFEKDRKTNLLDLLDEFKHEWFCNRNWGDCRDCENTKECDAINTAYELILNSKER